MSSKTADTVKAYAPIHHVPLLSPQHTFRECLETHQFKSIASSYVEIQLTYRKIPNISPPEYKPPYSLTQIPFRIYAPSNISPLKNMVIYEYQVLPLNRSKTGEYVGSHEIKRYQDGFRQILEQQKGDFCLKNDRFCQ